MTTSAKAKERRGPRWEERRHTLPVLDDRWLELAAEVMRGGVRETLDWLRGPCGQMWLHLAALDPQQVWRIATTGTTLAGTPYTFLEKCPRPSCRMEKPHQETSNGPRHEIPQ